jgi:hypothetical protein
MYCVDGLEENEHWTKKIVEGKGCNRIAGANPEFACRN